MKGFKRFVRPSGSEWFLCDYCEDVAYCTPDESSMEKHVKKKHWDEEGI